MASVTLLLAISSYNVVPTLRRAIDGDPAAIGLVARVIQTEDRDA
jgi:hypothetical protein